MAITTKAELATYCLQSLGQPVIKINVATEQVDERIDDAIDYFQERHYDGSEEVWIAFTITATDVGNGYIMVPDDVITIVEIGGADNGTVMGVEAKFSARYMQGSSLFNPIASMGGSGLVDYYLMSTAFSEVTDMMTSIPRFEHVKHSNKLYVFAKELVEDNYVFVRCFKKLDMSGVSKAYNDRWLKNYATQLIKKQWASNLGKHANIQLLGGITVNSSELYEQANADIEKLELQLKEEYGEPVNFFII